MIPLSSESKKKSYGRSIPHSKTLIYEGVVWWCLLRDGCEKRAKNINWVDLIPKMWHLLTWMTKFDHFSSSLNCKNVILSASNFSESILERPDSAIDHLLNELFFQTTRFRSKVKRILNSLYVRLSEHCSSWSKQNNNLIFISYIHSFPYTMFVKWLVCNKTNLIASNRVFEPITNNRKNSFK